MTETTLPPLESPRRFHFRWVPDVFIRPRQAFTRITGQTTGVWLTPLLILTLTALLQVALAGPVKQAAAMNGPATMPPDFQWWTPEQQAQWQQAMAATSGPVFIYVFPALSALIRVWGGWLIVGGLIHLVLTMLGGRADTGMAMNLVAWSALPLGLRDLVRAGSILATDRLIAAPGLMGFTPAGEGTGYAFLAALLAMVDLYLIWHAVLLILGVRLGTQLPRGKAVFGVLLTLLSVLALNALVSALTSSLGSLTIIRTF